MNSYVTPVDCEACGEEFTPHEGRRCPDCWPWDWTE